MGRWTFSSKIIPLIFIWFVLLGLSGLYFAIVFPALIKDIPNEAYYLFGINVFLFLCSSFNMLTSTFIEPGIYPKGAELGENERMPPISHTVVIKGTSVQVKWCATCNFYRPPRCSHCSVCDGCVEMFDHHCPWINNCVGRRNYRFFFMSLLFVSLHIIFVVSLSICHIVFHRDSLSGLSTISALIIASFGIVFFFPVLGLTGFHIHLVCRGRTTYEHITGRLGRNNLYSSTFLGNCNSTLCRPLWPSFLTYINGLPNLVQGVSEAPSRKPSQFSSVPYPQTHGSAQNEGANSFPVYSTKQSSPLKTIVSVSCNSENGSQSGVSSTLYTHCSTNKNGNVPSSNAARMDSNLLNYSALSPNPIGSQVSSENDLFLLPAKNDSRIKDGRVIPMRDETLDSGWEKDEVQSIPSFMIWKKQNTEENVVLLTETEKIDSVENASLLPPNEESLNRKNNLRRSGRPTVL